MQFSKNWARRIGLACVLTTLPLAATQRSKDRYAGGVCVDEEFLVLRLSTP
jgi:hypothetical protein